MTNKLLYQIKIWVKDEKGNVPTEPTIYKNIKSYSLVDQKLWFMRYEGELLEKQGNKPFGSYEVPFEWIPIDRVFKIEAVEETIFSDHYEKEKFIKEILHGPKTQ